MAKTRNEPDERISRLTASAQAAMDSIDAQPMAFNGTVKMYVGQSGRRYVTLVGEQNGRPFAEVFAPVTADPSWDATTRALIAIEYAG